MMGGKCLNHARYSRELISRKGMRDDEHSTMGPLVIEKSNREVNEIISISGHKTPFLCGSKVELPLIRCPAHSNLMGTKRINSTFSKYLGNLRAKVFIQVKGHKDDLIKG